MINNVRSYQAVARWVLCHQNFIFVLVSTRDYLIVHSLYYGLTFVFVFFGRVAISGDWAFGYPTTGPSSISAHPKSYIRPTHEPGLDKRWLEHHQATAQMFSNSIGHRHSFYPQFRPEAPFMDVLEI